MTNLDVTTFERIVADALDVLPEWVPLDNVAVTVSDEVTSPPLLGQYWAMPGMPSVITLYRIPIVARCVDDQAVRDQVRTVLLHELGHHVGLDHSQLDALGLGA